LLKKLALFAAFGPISTHALGVGFRTIDVPAGNDVPFKVAMWYPTESPADVHRLGPFTQTVAINGDIAGRKLALVVMSHGTAGWYGAQYDTAMALARAGFVVAAPTHSGDNIMDQSRSTQLADRPLQIQLVIAYLLGPWSHHRRIDANRVGVYGFSAGALTALIIAGGEPDLGMLAAHCRDHPEFFDCQLLRAHASSSPPMTTPTWIHDAHVKAVVVVAPALGFTFVPNGLKRVTIPVQLWRASADHILPSPYYAEAVRDSLPIPPDYRVAEGADHLDFLPVCTSRLKVSSPDLCMDHGFDRLRFHKTFNEAVVAFFLRTL
jgi:predicted dienelactone hydrolase